MTLFLANRPMRGSRPGEGPSSRTPAPERSGHPDTADPHTRQLARARDAPPRPRDSRARPAARDASDWPAPSPPPGPGPNRGPSSGRPRPERARRRRAGVGLPGSRREPSGAARSRTEPERPECERRSAGGRKRGRAQPEGTEPFRTGCARRALGSAQPARWRPRARRWPEVGLAAAIRPRTACGCPSARPLRRTGGAARRSRVTPSAEPTSGAGSTWAGPGAERGRRS